MMTTAVFAIELANFCAVRLVLPCFTWSALSLRCQLSQTKIGSAPYVKQTKSLECQIVPQPLRSQISYTDKNIWVTIDTAASTGFWQEDSLCKFEGHTFDWTDLNIVVSAAKTKMATFGTTPLRSSWRICSGCSMKMTWSTCCVVKSVNSGRKSIGKWRSPRRSLLRRRATRKATLTVKMVCLIKDREKLNQPCS
jgi:hypothetical protein